MTIVEHAKSIYKLSQKLEQANRAAQQAQSIPKNTERYVNEVAKILNISPTDIAIGPETELFSYKRMRIDGIHIMRCAFRKDLAASTHY